MHSRKRLFILWFLVLTTMWVSFWYYEDDLYCHIEDNNIKISLNKHDGGKCTEYVKYLEQKMKVVYKDILTIQWYINKRQDAWYWRPIKEEKMRLLNNLQKRRLNILINMRTFENNLLAKFKELFLAKIQTQKEKLEKAIITIDALSGTSESSKAEIEKYSQLAKDTLNTIRGIENAKTFTRFNKIVKDYLYFTKQLEWK